MAVHTSAITKSFNALEGAWDWWIGQLSSLLPFSAKSNRTASIVFVEICGDESLICKSKKGKVSVVERVRAEARRPRSLALLKKAKGLDVVIPRDQAFVLTKEFPVAAGANLKSVVGLQIDRLSPLKSDQIYFDVEVEPPKPRAEKVATQIGLVRKSDIDDAVKRIAAWGVSPKRIALAANDQVQQTSFNFLPREEGEEGLTTFQLNVLLVVLIIVASMFTWDVVTDRWQRDISAWQNAVSQAKAEAQVAADIQSELDALETQRMNLIQKKIAPSPLAVMTELSRVVPSTAWIQEMQMEKHAIRIIGFAENASLLPAILEESPLFAKAQFKAPVRKQPHQKGERFDLSLTLAGDKSP